MDIRTFIRKDLRDMVNYQVQPVRGIKMDANESPFPMSRELRGEIAKWIQEEETLRFYPDTDCVELRRTIAETSGLSADQVLCGVGSDQIIDFLMKTFLEEGDTILVPEPSFSMYALSAKINHGKAVAFDLNAEDFSYPIDTILQLCRERKPKILFLCTPNNPTGSPLERCELERILEGVSCIVALDEAYGEFSGQNDLDLIETYPNLVSLRTFSKAFGLAGLRVGYALGSREMIQALDTVKAPYNLSTIAQLTAAKVLRRPEYKEHIAWILRERDRMYEQLRQLEGKQGFYCYPSSANYFFMRSNVENLGALLLERGLLVRAYTGSLKSYIRASITTQEGNDLFLASLWEILEGIES